MDTSCFSNRYGQRLDATYHSAPNDAYLAILGHGITGNKDRPLIIGVAEELANLGIPSLRFSFAGNGKSQGRFEDCTITSQTEDLVDLLAHVSNSSRHIIYIGHSLGGAVGTLVAANEPNRIHTLVSLAGMVHTTAFFQREFGEQTPGDGFMWDEPACPLSQKAWDNAHEVHNTLDAAQRISQPWLLFHGGKDDVVPISDSRDALAATASPRTDFYERPNEEHMFSKDAYPEIAKAIVNFLR